MNIGDKAFPRVTLHVEALGETMTAAVLQHAEHTTMARAAAWAREAAHAMLTEQDDRHDK